MKRAVPGIVTLPWIKTNLPQYRADASARTLLSALKKLGLIDLDSKPTSIANKWRIDGEYKQACREILNLSFPEEIVSAFPSSPVDEARLFDALMNYGCGHKTATAVGKLFVLLIDADLEVLNITKKKMREKPLQVRKEQVQEVANIELPVCAPETMINRYDDLRLTFMLGPGRVADLRIPADITDAERRRLLKHLTIDLGEDPI